MSKTELVNVVKFVLVLFGYFIGTGLLGVIITNDDNPDTFSASAWVVGGIAFALLATCV